ncbi:MAG: hypothetical protein HN855_16705 [Anaerolineae bacterium]|jgi:5-methylcytosine-specific restriction endonuclease McrA|nr:hypothetical protein [Anaerolineae bacterium]MBT7071547.1 hypothetical protein [Anaerolineae bacterium]MBT7326790.1 hypothetical protein [Anaerolineae bacterium]
MTSYIQQNKDELRKRHYVRKAGSRDYWFDFTYKKMQSFQEKHGDDFSLVLYKSTLVDDCYVLPFSEVKNVFADNLLDERKRWIGYISKDILHIVRHPNSKGVSVASYFNNFEPLWGKDAHEIDEPEIDETLDNIDGELQIGNLHKLIEKFNKRFHEVKPKKKGVISERISRPGAISNYIKRLRNYTCEICGEKGFEQKNGNLYIEAHHIIELHELIPNSYCSDNIVVVCPTCHRKLHYGDVKYHNLNDNQIIRPLA